MVDEQKRAQLEQIGRIDDDQKGLHKIGLPGMEVLLQDTQDVWFPHDPTIRFIQALSDERIISESIQDKSVLDLGTGSAVVGIWALGRGAAKATMTDINPRALEVAAENVQLNGMSHETRQFSIIESDAFMGIRETFDTIISNPPVQPSSNRDDNLATKFNETQYGGRYVLDSLIRYGRTYLNPDGKLYILCSSRHGHETTKRMLNTYFGEEAQAWQTLEEIEYPIDPGYHGPYMEYWLEMQARDGDIRVYARDEQGREVHPSVYDPNDASLKWYSRSYIIEARNNDGITK